VVVEGGEEDGESGSGTRCNNTKMMLASRVVDYGMGVRSARLIVVMRIYLLVYFLLSCGLEQSIYCIECEVTAASF